jgi:hypothetical protein
VVGFLQRRVSYFDSVQYSRDPQVPDYNRFQKESIKRRGIGLGQGLYVRRSKVNADSQSSQVDTFFLSMKQLQTGEALDLLRVCYDLDDTTAGL